MTLREVSEFERNACEMQSRVSGPGYYEAADETVRELIAAAEKATAESFAASPQQGPPAAVIEFPPNCERMRQLPMAIPFIRGETTPEHMQHGFDEYANCLPAHETVVIVGASHMVHLDNPSEFNAALLQFLDQQ
jgi:pimeloyl-ACP methyl ester carboxylesterase